MIKVREVETKPGHRLALAFSDGTRGEVDFRPMLACKAFAKLKDDRVFAGAFVEHGAVTWPGDVAIASEALFAMAHDLPHPETLETAQANEIEVSLRELRRMAHVTQAEVAERLEIDQGQLSRFERQDDRLLSTLYRYVEALGGKLDVVVTIGDKRVTINGVAGLQANDNRQAPAQYAASPRRRVAARVGAPSDKSALKLAAMTKAMGKPERATAFRQAAKPMAPSARETVASKPGRRRKA